MAYFPDSKAIADYKFQYCKKCVNWKDDGCPVMDVHLHYNYNQIGDDEEAQSIKSILSTLIPTKGLDNLKCTLCYRPYRFRRPKRPMKEVKP